MGRKSAKCPSRISKSNKRSQAAAKRWKNLKIELNSSGKTTNNKEDCSSPPLINMEELLIANENQDSPHPDVSDHKAQLSSISDEDYKILQRHELVTEKVPAPLEEIVIVGNRIIDFQYVINKVLRIQYQHSKVCTFGELQIKDECSKGYGLISKIYLQCMFCSKLYTFFTESPNKDKSHIHTGAVWGTLAAGSTFKCTNQIFAAMNIPPMQYYMFQKIESSLQEIWKDSLWIEMQKAGAEELQFAKEKNQIDAEGVPYITVYVDGGWSKRSYGHNYNAASGVGVIIGMATKKVIFVGVSSVAARRD